LNALEEKDDIIDDLNETISELKSENLRHKKAKDRYLDLKESELSDLEKYHNNTLERQIEKQQ